MASVELLGGQSMGPEQLALAANQSNEPKQLHQLAEGNMQSITIAIISDEPSVRQSMRAALQRGSFTITEYGSSVEDEQDELGNAYALCLSILDESGLAVLRRLRDADPELPVIGVGAANLASRALDAGAYDFVARPIDESTLLRVVQHAVERRQLTNEVHELRSELTTRGEGGETTGAVVVPLRELERQAIARALQATKGSVTKAAKLLGIGRATLYRRLASPEMASLRPRRGFEGAHLSDADHPSLAAAND